MDSNSDTVEKFLTRVTLNTEQTVFDSFSGFIECDQSFTVSSDPFFSSIRQYLDSSPKNDDNAENKAILKYSDEFVRGLSFVNKCKESIDIVTEEKEDLRHHLRNPVSENSLPIHYNNIEIFLQMINTLSQVGVKEGDYSSMTSVKILSNLRKQIEKLDDLEKKSEEVLQFSLNIAADIEHNQQKKPKRMTLNESVF